MGRKTATDGVVTLVGRAKAGAAWRLRRLHEQALYRLARIYRRTLRKTQDARFHRVKIGIGRPAAGVGTLEYLLAPFPAGQLPAVDEGCRAAGDRVLELIRQEAARRALSP